VCKNLHDLPPGVTPHAPKVIILNSLVAPKGHTPWPRTCVSTSTDGQCGGHTKVMRTTWLSAILKPAAAVLAVFAFCPLGLAQQQVSYALLQPAAVGAAPMVQSFQTVAPSHPYAEHRFWDRDNSILFATNAAFSAADFVVTRDNLRNGGQELNPITRVFTGSTPALAMNFAGETAGVVGLSYFFHKMGHHRLERAVSLLNIGGSAAAISFGLAHR
jgi:hypothetical protein